jgi:hypothetical protein
MRTGSRLAIVCGAALTAAAAANADSIQIFGDTANSTEGLGNFEGTITYTPTMGNMGQLLISLTNTSPAATGGYITAFVFNTGDAVNVNVEYISGPANFNGIFDVNGQPFGMHFVAGASTSDQFEGGGAPQGGLGVGQTGDFEFKITADNAGDLSAEDFLSGPYDFNFVVRFRGFEPDGSDKVPAGGTMIPLPTAGAMAASGLLLIGVRRRRRAG